MSRPYVISIAGFDPSAGAGILADIKTFEQHKVYGFGACTALTSQNDQEFLNLSWLSTENILQQLEPLLGRFEIQACKIGIIPSLKTLAAVLKFIKKYKPDMPVVFDPVLKATSGFSFHEELNTAELREILQQITLLTPNFNEMQQLQKMIKNEFRIEEFTNILLKGGHNPDKVGVDVLYQHGKALEIPAGLPSVFPKHGSGCVLSSAITARLALGHTLPEACRLANTYTETFLNSDTSLLGYHNL